LYKEKGAQIVALIISISNIPEMEPLTCSSVSDMALPSERGDLNRHHAASASDCQVVTTETHDYQQVSQSYCGFGIESIWQEFDSRKRSAEYHLNKVRECLHYFKGPDDATTALECQDVVLGQHAVNKDSQYQWHLKVEYDKAARDLIVMENILKILMSNDSSAAEVRSHFASAAMSLVVPFDPFRSKSVPILLNNPATCSLTNVNEPLL
jgi:hypothetical protein